MSDPKIFKKDVPDHYGLAIEVDVKKCDCRRGEGSHCHLTRDGIRIAQIYVRPIRWENKPDGINSSTKRDIENLISSYEYEIDETYCWNAEHGADY